MFKNNYNYSETLHLSGGEKGDISRRLRTAEYFIIRMCSGKENGYGQAHKIQVYLFTP